MKKKLDTVYDYDFELMGLISSVRGYKLAWEIGTALEANLLRNSDLVIQFDKNNTNIYRHYASENKLHKIRLFNNQPHEMNLKIGKRSLVPEYPYLDYIVMSEGENRLDPHRIKQRLQHVVSVEMLVFIPLTVLKSKEFFIF